MKGKAFTENFNYSDLYTWTYAEALPCVTRIPINMGPDASKRNRIAMSGGLPKLFRFAKSMLGKDPEAKVTSRGSPAAPCRPCRQPDHVAWIAFGCDASAHTAYTCS